MDERIEEIEIFGIRHKFRVENNKWKVVEIIKEAKYEHNENQE